jgi:hypothetical protein
VRLYPTFFYRLVWKIGGVGITCVTNITQHDLQEIIWNKTILLKPSIFAWRILRNRIPAKDNPVKRRIIQENMNVCVDGCGYEENIYHLCLGCRFF